MAISSAGSTRTRGGIRFMVGLLAAASLLAACGGGGSSAKSSAKTDAKTEKSDSSDTSAASDKATVTDAQLQSLVDTYFDGVAANDYQKVVDIVGPQLAAQVATFAALDTLQADADKWKLPPTTIKSLTGKVHADTVKGGIVTAKGPLQVTYAADTEGPHEITDLVFDTKGSGLKLVDLKSDGSSVATRSLAPGGKTVPVGNDGTISVYSAYEFPPKKGLVNQIDYVFEVRSGADPIVMADGKDALVFTPTGLAPITQTGAWSWRGDTAPRTTTYIGYFFQSDGGVPDFGGKVALKLMVGGAPQTVELDVPPFTTYDGKATKAHDVLDVAPALPASSS